MFKEDVIGDEGATASFSSVAVGCEANDDGADGPEREH